MKRMMIDRWLLPMTLAIALGTAGLSGCNQLARFGIGVTPVSQVANNPSQYKDVTVRGTVVNQVGLFGKGAYELRDDTGSIWIVTQQGMPPMNSTLTVRGRAAEGLTIAGNRLAVTLTETERL